MDVSFDESLDVADVRFYVKIVSDDYVYEEPDLACEPE